VFGRTFEFAAGHPDAVVVPLLAEVGGVRDDEISTPPWGFHVGDERRDPLTRDPLDVAVDIGRGERCGEEVDSVGNGRRPLGGVLTVRDRERRLGRSHDRLELHGRQGGPRLRRLEVGRISRYADIGWASHGSPSPGSCQSWYPMSMA